MRILLFGAFASLAACSASSGAPARSDAGHDAGEDTGTPDTGSPGLLDTGMGGDETGPTCAGVGAVWAQMDRQPIFMSDATKMGHTVVGGVDLDGASGSGVTIPEVEAHLCRGSPAGKGPDETLLEVWGVSNELELTYDPTTFGVEAVSLFPGYLGTMTLPTDPSGPDAGHTFTIGLGPMLRDGQPFSIDWTDVGFTAGNQLYNAIQYNAQCYVGYGAAPCNTTGACPTMISGTERLWTIVAAGATLHFDLGSAEGTTVVEIDLALL